MEITLRVNGSRRTVEVDPRVSLLDLLRERLGPDRLEEGLRSRPVRRVHRADRRPAGQRLPGAGRGAGRIGRSPPSRAWRTAIGRIRSRPRSSSTTPSSAATAPPASSARRSGCWPRRGPSAVTEDVAADPALTAEEIRERMSGNLCRCGAYLEHRRRDRGGRPDEALRVRAGRRPRRRRGQVPARRDVPRRRHQPRRPHASRRGRARVPGGRQPAAARPDRARRRRGLRVGAAVRNSDLAAHPLVRERYPMLARAVLAGASGQIRNMATVGGNLLQRTRCPYFQDVSKPCNKREPGSGCPAIERRPQQPRHPRALPSSAWPPTRPTWRSRSPRSTLACTSPGPAATASIPMPGLHRLPGDEPERDTVLAPGELITAVDLPAAAGAAAPRYRKVRERASFAFALVSVAAAARRRGDGTVRDCRIALGGVAHVPWRAERAERALRGAPATEESFTRAAEAELEQARPLPRNAHKVPLARNLIVRTLRGAGTDDPDRGRTTRSPAARGTPTRPTTPIAGRHLRLPGPGRDRQGPHHLDRRDGGARPAGRARRAVQ